MAADRPDAENGFYQVRMRHVGTGDERVVYEGDGTQKFLSGLLNGEYEFRVRYRPNDQGPWGQWSETKIITVAHHDMAFALTLFGCGGILFALTVAFILRHHRREGAGLLRDERSAS